MSLIPSQPYFLFPTFHHLQLNVSQGTPPASWSLTGKEAPQALVAHKCFLSWDQRTWPHGLRYSVKTLQMFCDVRRRLKDTSILMSPKIHVTASMSATTTSENHVIQTTEQSGNCIPFSHPYPIRLGIPRVSCPPATFSQSNLSGFKTVG